jgi:hypothetical protein
MPLTTKVAPSSCAIVNGFGEVTDILPMNSQMVGSIKLPPTLSTKPFSGKALEASHAATVGWGEGGDSTLKFTPVVVNVTSALAVVHAPAPL